MSKKISLAAARILAGLTQQEAAEMFGVHYQTLAKWEKDAGSMKFSAVSKIPEIYSVTVDSIFFGTENEFNRYYSENEKTNEISKITK
ncbi:helix-turn-helix transcriptional regulator [Enterococcus sp.]|uniref:helix-turn-helix transcriptional regulator n=1 Tax=Enterococcus sp. TaxID=35783 RepID=UPI003C75AFEC